MSKADVRALRSLSLAQIERRVPTYARALAWLHAVRLLPAPLLQHLVWPHTTARQQRYGLARLLDAGLLDTGDVLDVSALQLGRRGAKVLAEAGHPARYRPLPGTTAADGLLRGGVFVAALALWLQSQPCARALRWSAQPFAGSVVRPDGLGTIIWANAPSYEPLAVLPWSRQARQGEREMHLALEIDDGTEYARQLRRRAEHWQQALRTPTGAGLPAVGALRVLWVTSGGWRRAWQIARCWEAVWPDCAAFVTTTSELQAPRPADLPELAGARWLTDGGEWVTTAEAAGMV